MPSGKVHLIGGTLATVALTCTFRLPYEMILIGSLAGLLPDIDSRQSILGRWIPLWLFCKHRGFTHSLWALILSTATCLILSGSVAATLCFFVGYFSHLALDWMTPMGIPWKWPRKKLYRLRR